MPFVNIRIYEGWGKDEDRRDRGARHRRDPRRHQAAQGGGVGGGRGSRPAAVVRGGQARGADEEMTLDIRDPRFAAVVDREVRSSTIAHGCLFTEGPLWHPRDGYLLWSDMPDDHLRRWSAKDGVTHVPQALQQVQRPHVGSRRAASSPASTRRARSRAPSADGRITPLATHYEGKELNSPNDIVCAADGGIYFTDPGVRPHGVLRRQARPRSSTFRGVYRVGAGPDSRRCCSPTTSTSRTASASRWTGARLFVNDTAPQAHPRLRRDARGGLTGGGVWAETHGEGAGRTRRHEDRLGRQRVLLRAGRHPRVRSRRRSASGVIRVPEYTANMAFGDDDLRIAVHHRLDLGLPDRASGSPGLLRRSSVSDTSPEEAPMLRVSTLFALLLAAGLALPLAADAQKPIKVGFPMILSGPGALFGEPALKGAQMYVDEVNAKGGVLGRKLELVPRDTKGNADEAVRVVARADPEGERRLPRRHADVGRGAGGLRRGQGEQDRLHRADPEDRPAHRAGQAASVRVPRRVDDDHRRAQRRRDHRQVAGDQGRDDQPRLRLRPGRDQVVRRAPQEDQAVGRRSSTSSGRSSARPTTRRSSTRRWRRSRRRCSRRCGAATS